MGFLKKREGKSLKSASEFLLPIPPGCSMEKRPEALKLGTFFQPGTHWEHFLRGAKLSTKNLRGLKKCTEKIRGLKILDVA